MTRCVFFVFFPFSFSLTLAPYFITPAGKNVLIVYAHQSAGSFNAAAKDASVEQLTAEGCNVVVSDLYAMKFKAAATEEDVTGALIHRVHLKKRL